MNLPSEKQARLYWFSLSALAVGVLAGLLGIFLWGLGLVVTRLTPVLLPLAMAGVAAYLLEPVVSFLVRRGMTRLRAILLAFALVLTAVLGLFGTVAPRLVIETQEFVRSAPEYAAKIHQRATAWISTSQWAQDLIQKSTAPGTTGQAPDPAARIGEILPAIGGWLQVQAVRLASWVGLLLGLLLAPVYTFYFLLESDGIKRGWQEYLPITNARIKREVIFVISSINDSLIVFFRGQVLVSMCSGTLLTIAFLSMGLNYALFLGAMAGMLGIIPYLGCAISLIPAVTLAALQFQDWTHPLLVLGAFATVNLLEGLVISPKIIGDRVGLHPLAIMVAIMIGTTLLGGILGGLLAIPLTAALRTILMRYVWTSPSPEAVATPATVPSTADKK